MKKLSQNDWLAIAAVLLLLLWLSRRKPVEVVTSTFTFPGADYDSDGTYRGDTSGDLFSHIIAQQGDTVINY